MAEDGPQERPSDAPGEKPAATADAGGAGEAMGIGAGFGAGVGAGFGAGFGSGFGAGFGLRLTNPLMLVGLYLVACSALFLAVPGLDTWFAGLFHAPDGFPAANIAVLGQLRRLGDQLVILVLVVLAASLIGKLVWPRRPIAIRPRSTAYLLASLALGPGLVVNALFKTFSGRPRPYQTDLFGGAWTFEPAWHFGGACVSNCSFISGEASTAIWLLAPVLLLPRELRLPVGIPVALVGLALSLNRIAFGGHYLSDVMLSWGITLAIVLVLHRLIVTGPLGQRIDAAVENALARAGLRLRKIGGPK